MGILVAVGHSAVLGAFWSSDLSSYELMSRTDAGPESVALALASGAAAAQSLTTGLSSVLVEVMVAVALLPPATTLGLMLGIWNLDLALGAGLLLAVNVVCVNLASKVVFFLKGTHPRVLSETKRARRATLVYILGWIVALSALVLAISARQAWME